MIKIKCAGHYWYQGCSREASFVGNILPFWAIFKPLLALINSTLANVCSSKDASGITSYQYDLWGNFYSGRWLCHIAIAALLCGIQIGEISWDVPLNKTPWSLNILQASSIDFENRR